MRYEADIALVSQLLSGDERAFSTFFDEYFSRVYRFVLNRVGSAQEATAADLAQQAMTKAVQKLDGYRGESQLFTWLCAIARNEVADWARSDARRNAVTISVDESPAMRAVIDSFRAEPSDEPDTRVYREQHCQIIQVALDALPARYGDALEWKYIQGFSVAEIAGKLDIGETAAQSLLARARTAFADVYQGVSATDINPLQGRTSS